MKTNQILFAAVVATTLSLASQANAQFKVNEDDGIAASPKVRQMLDERKASQAAAVVPNKSTTSQAVGSDNIVASPKARQMFDEQRASTPVTTPSPGSTSLAGYRPVHDDGITASPKLREQLDERSGSLMIAPVK